MTTDDLVTCPRAPGTLRLSPGRCVQLWRDTQETMRRRSYLKAQHRTNMMLRPMDVYREECATCPVGRERSEHYEASGHRQVPEPKAEVFTFQRFAVAEGWSCEREMFEAMVRAHGYPKRIAAVLGVTIASVSQRLQLVGVKALDGRRYGKRWSTYTKSPA